MFARDGVDARDRLQDGQMHRLTSTTGLVRGSCEFLLGQHAERVQVVFVCEDVHVDVQGELA